MTYKKRKEYNLERLSNAIGYEFQHNFKHQAEGDKDKFFNDYAISMIDAIKNGFNTDSKEMIKNKDVDFTTEDYAKFTKVFADKLRVSI